MPEVQRYIEDVGDEILKILPRNQELVKMVLEYVGQHLPEPAPDPLTPPLELIPA